VLLAVVGNTDGGTLVNDLKFDNIRVPCYYVYMKLCRSCGIEKTLAEFNKKGERLQGKCKVCQAKWYKDYYDNADVEKERLRVKRVKDRKEFHDLLVELKSVPCMDCGRSYPSYVMDFDHRDPKVKLFTIGTARGLYTIKKILSEIDKCDVVCSNCHRERTHRK